MKKIMFNERYGLQQAVMNGSKTMTRRIVKFSDEELALVEQFPKKYLIARYAQYKVGEVVAIAQSYEDIYRNGSSNYGSYEIVRDCQKFEGKDPTKLSGWKNKMFVRPELMLHHIKITDIRFERLQDISDEDCMRGGIKKSMFMDTSGKSLYGFGEHEDEWHTPREAFAALIDKVSGKGTWDKNPWVMAYTFRSYYPNLKPIMQGTSTGGIKK